MFWLRHGLLAKAVCVCKDVLGPYCQLDCAAHSSRQAAARQPTCQYRPHRRDRSTQVQAAGLLAPLASSSFWAEITSNVIFMAGFWGWAVAQVAKVFTYYIKKGKWDLSQLVASGGMPSSHSSLCMVRSHSYPHGPPSSHQPVPNQRHNCRHTHKAPHFFHPAFLPHQLAS